MVLSDEDLDALSGLLQDLCKTLDKNLRKTQFTRTPHPVTLGPLETPTWARLTKELGGSRPILGWIWGTAGLELIDGAQTSAYAGAPIAADWIDEANRSFTLRQTGPLDFVITEWREGEGETCVAQDVELPTVWGELTLRYRHYYLPDAEGAMRPTALCLIGKA